MKHPFCILIVLLTLPWLTVAGNLKVTGEKDPVEEIITDSYRAYQQLDYYENVTRNSERI